MKCFVAGLLWCAAALERRQPSAPGLVPGPVETFPGPTLWKPVGDFDSNTRYAAARTDPDWCKPKCRWSCEAPECSEVCNITCAPALCATACPPINVQRCRTVCPPPKCHTVCAGNCVAPNRRAPPCTEPDCRTECDPPHPLCKSDCDLNCEARCAPPACRFTCVEPSDCPKPVCRLTCERMEACPFPKVTTKMPVFPEGLSHAGLPRALAGVKYLSPMVQQAPPATPAPAPGPAPAPAPLPAPTQLAR